MKTMQPEHHRLHDALEKVHVPHGMEEFAHDHSPLARFRLDIDQLDIHLTREDLEDQLVDHPDRSAV
jgi:hypothetical protein